MANEFVAKNGLISQNNTTVTGSLTVSGSGFTSIGNIVITGSSIINNLFLSETSTNIYRVGNLITNNGYSAGGTNQTYDVFSIGLNPSSSGVTNTTSFFRTNFNGGNSPTGV
jgi:hypothetical protein